MFTGENKAIATGNVVFAQGNNRISAEHAEFDTETRLGTFYNATRHSRRSSRRAASGAARRDGAAADDRPGDTSSIFFGEKIEKIGPKKYRITNGGFSTCVQPTPRWDLHAGTVILNVDHYTVLTNAVLTGEGRADVLPADPLLPDQARGSRDRLPDSDLRLSSLRGQSIHNAFFWAINRSQDATFLHDWFSKTGQGVGSEYRYNCGGGGDGNFAPTCSTSTARPTSSTACEQRRRRRQRSYEIRGGANQMLPGQPARARQRQLLLEHRRPRRRSTPTSTMLRATSRSFGGNVVGAWGKLLAQRHPRSQRVLLQPRPIRR